MVLEKRVIEVVEKNLEKKRTVDLESRLIEDLGVDSFNKIMIIAAIEDEFQIEIDEDDIGEIKKVSDIISELRSKYPDIGEE